MIIMTMVIMMMMMMIMMLNIDKVMVNDIMKMVIIMKMVMIFDIGRLNVGIEKYRSQSSSS